MLTVLFKKYKFAAEIPIWVLPDATLVIVGADPLLSAKTAA